MKYCLLSIWMVMACVHALPAQLQLKVGEGEAVGSMDSGTSAAQSAIFSNPKILLPSHVRENPRGYSYLCRLELEIEEKLPVGVWMKTATPDLSGNLEGVLRQNAYVRFKLLRF